MPRDVCAVKEELVDDNSQELVLFRDNAASSSNSGDLFTKTSTGFNITIPFGNLGSLKRRARNAKFVIKEDMVNASRHSARLGVAHYGGQVVTKLEHADYYVLGAREYPHPDLIRRLCKHKVELLDETAFYDLLRDGVPKHKHLKGLSLDSEGYCVGGYDACRNYCGTEDRALPTRPAKRRRT